MNNLGWRRLNDPPSFWQRLKQDMKDMKNKKATALDWVLLWASMVIGILIYVWKGI